MRIILVRHGEHKGDKLTFLGKKQIRTLKKQLKYYNFEKVYCSPTDRCLQSAQILAGKKEIIVREGLNERFQLDHRPATEDEQAWWKHYMDPNFTSPVGETLKEFLKRNYEVFKDIEKENCDILVVAHSATTYALSSYLLKTQSVIWTRLGYGNMLCFEVK